MDAEIIEADFQQYYHLELWPLIRSKFARYCRLLLHLPLESRFVQKYCESKDWDWDKEVQSRILHELNAISCQLSNMLRKEGKAPRKMDEQFQPDYVKKAKEKTRQTKPGQAAYSKEDMEEIKKFWANYNSTAKRMDDGN